MNGSTTVLLVDDSRSALACMHDMLEQAGYAVIDAQNGRDALRLHESEPSDIIITDLDMPEMDGFELITAIRLKHPHTPIIVVSGIVKPDDIVEAHRLGAWDYLVKPVKNKFEVHIAIQRVLERSRIMEENRRYQQELVQLYTQDVRASKERYKRLLESLTSYVYTVIFDKNGQSETIHRPGCEMVTGYSCEDYTYNPNLWINIVYEDDRQKVLDVVENVLKSPDYQHLEHRICHKDGNIRWVSNTLVPCWVSGQLISYDGVITDITERKKTEERLRISEERYRIISEQSGQVVYDIDVSKDRLQWNGEVKRFTGYCLKELQQLDKVQRTELIHPDDRQVALDVKRQATRGLTAYKVEYRFRKKNGVYIYVEDHGVVLAAADGKGRRRLGMLEDITERKRSEQAVKESEAKLRLQFESMPIGCIMFDANFRVISWNPAAERIFGYTANEVEGKQVVKLIVQKEYREQVAKIWKRLLDGDHVLQNENGNITKDGSTIFCSWYNTPLFGDDGKVTSVLSMCQDITERVVAEEQLKHHVDNLAALSTIDAAINSSLDLRITLKVLLQETLKQLKVDAASVLLLDPYSQMLEYTAGLGFNTKRIDFSRIRLGESYAGRVAKDRRIRIVSDIVAFDSEEAPQTLIACEGFKAYVGVPLVAKGQVKGVLEIFHRSPLNPSQDWLVFVEAFANQAAIALDNAEIYDRLQNSHGELLLAYDSTIEGWSRALDFRDRETEGHSRRVTDLTVRIARELGIGKDKLIHLRRGALLHDIGKLGVPDSILLKPGKLTDEEFETMKQHTRIAFSILSPIEFLRPAIEIPHYHHEKWDGSGYPHGLKGEEIPLAARIFAYVDVWDALLSDRPYRKAWSFEAVRDYIREQSGKHFDPNMLAVIEKVVFEHAELWVPRYG